jgi:hypothetical protein
MILIILLLIPAMVTARITGLGTSDYTNGPTQNRNCTNCHGGTANSGSGNFRLSGLPATYMANSTYALTLRISQTGQARWGFQLKTSAGLIGVTDTTHTYLSNTTFLNHNSAGTYAGTTVGQWGFNWTAPSTTINPVTFYASGLAANNDGSQGTGDFTYTLASTIVGSTPVNLSGFYSE